jgi:hypothetical protein
MIVGAGALEVLSPSTAPALDVAAPVWNGSASPSTMGLGCCACERFPVGVAGQREEIAEACERASNGHSDCDGGSDDIVHHILCE